MNRTGKRRGGRNPLGRKILVDGLTYHWRVKRTVVFDGEDRIDVVISGVDYPSGAEVVGVSERSFNYGQAHGSKAGGVTPGHVADFIRKSQEHKDALADAASRVSA